MKRQKMQLLKMLVTTRGLIKADFYHLTRVCRF